MGFLSQTYITQGFESPVKKNCFDTKAGYARAPIAPTPVTVYTTLVIILVPVGSVAISVLEILAGDLYVPRLNFVFGTAGVRGAVISLTRLRQNFYGCEMFFSNSLSDTDRKGPAFCPLCRARLPNAAAL